MNWIDLIPLGCGVLGVGLVMAYFAVKTLQNNHYMD